jgi:excisionase family DNA binding protein
MRKLKTLPVPPPERLSLTADEASGLTGIAAGKIRELCKQGKLPHVRLGRRIIIRRVDLETFVDPSRRAAE